MTYFTQLTIDNHQPRYSLIKHELFYILYMAKMDVVYIKRHWTLK